LNRVNGELLVSLIVPAFIPPLSRHSASRYFAVTALLDQVQAVESNESRLSSTAFLTCTGSSTSPKPVAGQTILLCYFT